MNNARSLGLSLRRKYNYKQQIYGYHLANPWLGLTANPKWSTTIWCKER